MTFVTPVAKAGEGWPIDMIKRNNRATARQANIQIPFWLFGRLQFGFESFPIADNYVAAMDL